MNTDIIEKLAEELGLRAIEILEKNTTPKGNDLEVVKCAAALATSLCNVQITIWKKEIREIKPA